MHAEFATVIIRLVWIVPEYQMVRRPLIFAENVWNLLILDTTLVAVSNLVNSHRELVMLVKCTSTFSLVVWKMSPVLHASSLGMKFMFIFLIVFGALFLA